MMPFCHEDLFESLQTVQNLSLNWLQYRPPKESKHDREREREQKRENG